jgi:hypothetical protein
LRSSLIHRGSLDCEQHSSSEEGCCWYGGKGKVWWWIVVALFLLAFLSFVPQLQGRYFSQGVPAEEIPALVNEYRRTWAQILGGAALLSGIYFTWRTLQVNREGQITERFTRAIDQLGSEELEIRLGGIYALERIARESEEDHGPIMEVLTAFVRQRATLEDRTPTGSRVASVIDEPSPELDIQAILKVLSRRIDPKGYTESARLDLHFVDLPLADLSGADLRGADLSRANLRGADLSRIDLSGADLREADLWKADLREAKVTDEQLADALTLQGVTMPDGSKHP